MVFRQELMRFERLTNQRYPIAEVHRFLNFARNDAYCGLATRSGWLDVFAAGILANSIRMAECHLNIISIISKHSKQICIARKLPKLQNLPDAVLQCRQFLVGNHAQSAAQTFFRHRADLVAHGHDRSPIAHDRDQDRRAGLRRT